MSVEQLLKIDSIGKVAASLLVEIGIDTPGKLAHVDENVLFNKFAEMKEKGKISYQIRNAGQMIQATRTGEWQFSIARERYNSFIERSFQNELNVLLFKKLVLDEDENFIVYDNTLAEAEQEDVRGGYKDAYRDMSKIIDRNSKIGIWLNDPKNKSAYELLKKQFKDKFSQGLKWEDFKAKYGRDEDSRQCEYCKITEAEISRLIDRGKIVTKRLYSRGRSMEVDRLNSFKGYEVGNIVLCCYWCNNAKTDEFTEDEFTQVGKAIQAIWLSRNKK